MRHAMHNLGLAPDVVLVSTARRTLETLDALEPWDDAPLIEPLDSLYLANPMQLIAALPAWRKPRSVLLIGHNPGMHDLAISLAGPQAMRGGGEAERALAAGFPTGALAEFVVAGPGGICGRAVDGWAVPHPAMLEGSVRPDGTGARRCGGHHCGTVAPEGADRLPQRAAAHRFNQDRLA